MPAVTTNQGEMDSNVTGAAIRRLREARHLTQVQLGQRFDVNCCGVFLWPLEAEETDEAHSLMGDRV